MGGIGQESIQRTAKEQGGVEQERSYLINHLRIDPKVTADFGRRFPEIT